MKIYTDGSANPNPGPGGFGVLVLDNEEFFVYNIYTERSSKTTNNKEENSWTNNKKLNNLTFIYN